MNPVRMLQCGPAFADEESPVGELYAGLFFKLEDEEPFNRRK